MRLHSIRVVPLLLIMIISVACSAFDDGNLPTLVPVANEFAGPPGTQFLDAPWESTENIEAGVSIKQPQDWNGRVLTSGLRVIPNIPSSATGDFRMAAVASLGIVTGDEPLTAVIETMLTNMSAGQPDLIETIEPIATSSINGYSSASTRIQIQPILPDIDDPELEFSETEAGSPSKSSLIIVALRGEGQTAVFIGTTPVTLVDTYQPIFDDMVQTIQLSLPQTN